MPRSLGVGVPADARYANTVLAQLGIPAIVIKSLEEGLEQGVRVFFWNEANGLARLADAAIPECRVITSHRVTASLLSQQPEVDRSAYSFSAGPDGLDTSFYCQLPAWKLSSQTSGSTLDPAGNPLAGTGLLSQRFGAIGLDSLPWDLTTWHLGEDWGPRPYYSPELGKHFVEIGPAVESGALRRLLFSLLLGAFESLGLPLCRVSPFLDQKPHFAVRIDADGFSRKSTEAVLDIARRYQTPFTWFIDVAGWGDGIAMVPDLKAAGQDVQLHCYQHMTYVSKATNAANIRAGLRALSRQGVQANSIVSPFGYNHRGFADAIANGRFHYSSEFGAAVDDLPFYPFEDPSRPLQVPSHPGCIGVMRSSGYSENEIFHHLSKAIRRSAAQDGFGVLYGHPAGRIEEHTEQFGGLIQTLLDSGHGYLNMGEYARLWRTRKIPPDIILDEAGTIELPGCECSARFPLELFGAHAALDQVRSNGLPVRRGQPGPLSDSFVSPPEEILGVVEERVNKAVWEQQLTAGRWYFNHLGLDAATSKLGIRPVLSRAYRIFKSIRRRESAQ